MPIVAALPAIIGAGGSIAGGLLGRKSASGGMSSRQKSLLSTQEAAAQQQMEAGKSLTSTAGELKPLASNFLNLASSSYGPVIDYWKGLLSPGTTRASSILAPELTRISEGYTGATQSARSLLPRGGGTASLMSAAPFQQARDVSTLFQTVRPKAAEGLTSAGGGAGLLGTYGYGDVLRALTGAAGAAGGAGGTAANELNLMQRQQALEFEQSRALGSGIMSLLFGTQGPTGPTGLMGVLQQVLSRGKGGGSPIPTLGFPEGRDVSWG